jgi:hypothetical protein
MISEIKLADCVGKRLIVTTRNTRYEFDVFALNDIHGQGYNLRSNELPRYLDGRTSDVEIAGTKLSHYPWDSLTGNLAMYRKEDTIVAGGFLRFKYPGQHDYVNTSTICEIALVDFPTGNSDHA